ncbi:MAG TPA: TonB-dependent receptor [Sulfuricella sp.]|nr:TonB-dependent receptor [Sulfuricella sp.]
MASNAWCVEADQDATQQLKEVVVTSTTIDDRFDSKRDEPSSISVISGKEVDDAHVENIIQVLRSVPGVTADLSSGDEIKIKLRGIENQRYMGEKPGVAIIIDGVPVFERTGKVNIDLDNIESIKVIKGGASYLFGEDALSGAVIITTKRGAKYAGATVGMEAGSWGYEKQMARVGFSGEKGNGHIQVSHRYGDDYYFQSSYKTDYINGNYNLYLSDTSDLTFGFEKSDRNKDKHGSVKGVTQAELDPQGVLGRDYTRKYGVDLQKLNLTYSNNYDPRSNILLMGYEYRDTTNFLSAPQSLYADATSVLPSDPGYYDAYTTLNNWQQVQRGAKTEWRSSTGNVGWLAGLDLRRNEYQQLNKAGVDYCSRKQGAGCAPGASVTAGTIMTDDNTDESVNGAYGEVKFRPATDWTLTFNGRYDDLSLDYSAQPGKDNGNVSINRSKSFQNSSWRAGANYALKSNMDVYGNLSTGFRTPTVDQLYRGSLSPSNGKTANNENLRPEESLNLEFGLRTKTEWFGIEMDADASIFQIDRKDYIMATTGQYAGSSPTIQEMYDNIGGVRNRGFELALKSDRKREYAFDLAYSYIDAYFTKYDNFYQVLGSIYATNPTMVHFNNTGRAVPRVPAHQINLTGHWQPTSQFHLSLEMDAKSWAWADEINQEKLPGRTLFNLLANYDVKEKGFLGSKWSFFARVDNLFDRKYWVTARGTNDQANYITGAYDNVYNANDLSIVVGRPRTWYAGLSATF